MPMAFGGKVTEKFSARQILTPKIRMRIVCFYATGTLNMYMPHPLAELE